jgi:hypothetical protein
MESSCEWRQLGNGIAEGQGSQSSPGAPVSALPLQPVLTYWRHLQRRWATESASPTHKLQLSSVRNFCIDCWLSCQPVCPDSKMSAVARWLTGSVGTVREGISTKSFGGVQPHSATSNVASPLSCRNDVGCRTYRWDGAHCSLCICAWQTLTTSRPQADPCGYPVPRCFCPLLLQCSRA